MTIPGYILGVLVSTLFGAGFHLIYAGSARRFLLYLLAGWLGFGLGHWVGDLFDIHLLSVGTLNVFPASIGAIVALYASRLLAEVDLSAGDARG